MQSAEGCSLGGGGPAGFRSSGPCSALSGGTLPEGGSERGRPIPRNQRCAAGRSGLGALTGSCGRVCPRRGGSRRRGGRAGASAAPTATACGERGPHSDAGIPAAVGGAAGTRRRGRDVKTRTLEPCGEQKGSWRGSAGCERSQAALTTAHCLLNGKRSTQMTTYLCKDESSWVFLVLFCFCIFKLQLQVATLKRGPPEALQGWGGGVLFPVQVFPPPCHFSKLVINVAAFLWLPFKWRHALQHHLVSGSRIGRLVW